MDLQPYEAIERNESEEEIKSYLKKGQLPLTK